MPDLKNMQVKLFADGADQKGMLELHKNPYVKGFTTNPTLMYKAGVNNYEAFAKDILSIIKNEPISFEVFSDDFAEMKRQALKISEWGDNVYVKIPITNTKGELSLDLVRDLAQAGVKQNVTALFTPAQVTLATEALVDAPSSYISVFAGRIADAGFDYMDIMQQSLEIMKPYPYLELIWASPREIYNIIQANAIGCHIITVSHDLLQKLHLIGKDLNEYSLETVQIFYKDATTAGFRL